MNSCRTIQTCSCCGLCRRIVGLLWTQTSTIAGAVMARWCWKSVQLCNAFWISIVKVVIFERIDIFLDMGISAIFSMLGPNSWFCSSVALMSRFICGQMMSTFSKLGRAYWTHWCASHSSFCSLLVSITICSSMVCHSSASVDFWLSKASMPYLACLVCW